MIFAGTVRKSRLCFLLKPTCCSTSRTLLVFFGGKKKKSVLLDSPIEIRMFSYQMHAYGGGHCRLDLCSYVLNEGVFILPMHNHLSPSGGHQEGIVLLFVDVQDHLQP